ACQEVRRLDVSHDDPTSLRQGHATGTRGARINPPPEGGRFRMKSSAGQQPKFTLLRMERLHTSHVGRHQLNGGIEDAVVEGGEIAFLNKESADFLQSQRVVSSRALVRPASSVRHRALSDTFDGHITPGESQPPLFYF